jgi:cathepsin D
MMHSFRKYGNGFEAYQKNTGKTHSLASKVARSSNKRRSSVTDSLSPNQEQFWYGNISVGTPATSYSGWSLFLVAQL